jgi:tripeptide aminopeptidase
MSKLILNQTQAPRQVPRQKSKKISGIVFVQELKDLELSNAHVDEHGYVYMRTWQVMWKAMFPVFAFVHTWIPRRNCSGAGVNPSVHADYQGKDIVLPDARLSVIISPFRNILPIWPSNAGMTIITASGLTLLGADNKAGVAEIMACVGILVQHPDAPHGPISIDFTPDEEVGARHPTASIFKKLMPNTAIP